MITPVVLCGGSGTRLWPLSRKSYPKQFSSLTGPESLFQASVRRFAGDNFAAPIVVTSNDFRFIVTEQLSDVGIADSTVLIEPEGRDTAPAILAATLHQHKQDPDALLLVAPSDHVISNDDAFGDSIQVGIPAAVAGDIVTFGITPDRAETGYGYLELTEPPQNDLHSIKLKSFVEKPNSERAKELLEDGKFLWNAGIFLFSARTLIEAFKVHAPEIFEAVSNSVDEAHPDLSFIRLGAGSWSDATATSIDFAIMEKVANISVVPFGGSWSDLGDWSAVWRETEENGLSTNGNATAIECKNTLLRSEVDGQAIVGIGLEDVVAVAMPDAVLVAHKDSSQDVKQAVTILKEKGAPQAEHFPKDHRPWGWFESLVVGERFQVKRIVVHPGATLSLQSHHHRAEHWIVVEGTARVTIGDEVKLVSENESVYIPLGTVHRLDNPGKMNMVLIEVQTGAYLGEDDIIRYEDVYARD